MTAHRKPRPMLRPLARLTGRDAVWQAIRELSDPPGAEFTRHDLFRRVNCGMDLIRDQLRRLVRAGIVGEEAPPERAVRTRYRLVRDVGVEPPRVTAAGVLDEAPTDQERMWQAMKAMPAFRVADLQLATGIVSALSVQAYIKRLHQAGYLAVVEPAITAKRTASYRLLNSKNTGPRPPAIRRGKIVFDLNLGRQVWPAVPA
jgi:DNA-binding HxlR family transcriptional regulator